MLDGLRSGPNVNHSTAMALAERLAKNSTYLTASSLLQKILSLAYFTYVSGVLEYKLDNYLFALNFAGIFIIILNFGLIPALTREGSKQPDQLPQQLNIIITLKLFLSVIVVVAMLVVYHLLNWTKVAWLHSEPFTSSVTVLIYLAAIMIVFDTFRSIFLAVFRARQEMHFEAIGQLGYQIIVVAVGLTAVFYNYKGRGLLFALLVASGWYCLFALYLLIRKAKIHLHWVKPTWTSWKYWLYLAAPFALADAFFKLNGSLDSVMLKYLSDNSGDVSWHGIASKLVVTLTVIPGAFATAFFPVMSKAYIESREDMKHIFEQMMKYLLAISVPISIGVLVLAPKIIQSWYSKFPATTDALQIFALSIVLLFINYPIGNVLNAANKQGVNTLNMGIALLVNIILNIVLIPPYGYIGATIAAVVSTIVLVYLGWRQVKRIITIDYQALLQQFGKMLLAAIGMGVVLMLAESVLPLMLLILLGVVIYSVLVLTVGGISFSDVQAFYKVIRRR